MAKVSLSQAAKDTGVSLPTLSRWRKSGKISAIKNGSGGYIIDTSEYDRIGEFKKQSRNMKGETKGFMKETVTSNETANEMRVIEVEVNVLRERIRDKDSLIEDLREDRDEWKKQAQTLLLQNPIRSSEKSVESNKESSATHLAEAINNASTRQYKGVNTIYILLPFAILMLGGLLWFAISQSNIEESPKELVSKPILKSPYRNESLQSPKSPNFSFQQQLSSEKN